MYNTAIIAMFCQPVLLVKYLESYLSDLERGLSEWRIIINVLKCSTILFAKADRRIAKPDQFSSSGNQSSGSITPVILG